MPFSIDKNYYTTLNVEPSATSSEIKKAYYKLARETHPDKNPASDGEAFKRVHEAYEILFDEEQRQNYDNFLVESQQIPSTSPQAPTHNKRTPFQEPEDLYAKARDFFRQQYKTRQSKETSEANQRMSWLHLSKEKQTELWQIYQEFSRDTNHLQQTKYSVETLKNLLYVFSYINLSHLDVEYRNNPDIVDVSFHHSFAGLRYASEDAIVHLLARKDSVLYKELTYTQDYPWRKADFLKYYPYDVDTSLFIKLMSINPALIKPLSQEKIVGFLRDPECHQHKDKLPVHQLYKPDKYQTTYDRTYSADTNLEILFVIYRYYDRNILRKFNLFDDYSQNRHQLRQQTRRLLTKYPNEIDLRDIISIDKLVDQQSLRFSYDAEQETLTCTGKLFDEGYAQNCGFSNTTKLMEKNSAWFDTTFVYELATSLEPKIFCKMLASIPLEKRAKYLFSPNKYETDTAYYAYEDRLNRSSYSWSEQENNQIKAEKTKEHVDSLIGLLFPVKPISTDDLTKVKEQVCASLLNYTAWWKLSFFGHHHEERARQVINAINNACSLLQIGLIIENQLFLFEHHATTPPHQEAYNQFMLKRIFDTQPIDWRLEKRWYNSAPQNLPSQKDIMSSGYYRALISAKNILQEIDPCFAPNRVNN